MKKEERETNRGGRESEREKERLKKGREKERVRGGGSESLRGNNTSVELSMILIALLKLVRERIRWIYR